MFLENEVCEGCFHQHFTVLLTYKCFICVKCTVLLYMSTCFSTLEGVIYTLGGICVKIQTRFSDFLSAKTSLT